MIREDFLIKFNAGEYPNIFRAVSLPNGHKIDTRVVDTRFAVLVSGPSVGAVVECLWVDVSIEETRKFSRLKFVWLDSGWLTPGDPPMWGPFLLRVIETRFDAISRPSEVAKKYLAIAAALDPEIEILLSALDEVEEGSDMVASMEGLNVPERLRRMADLLEAGLSEAKSAVNEFLEGEQS